MYEWWHHPRKELLDCQRENNRETGDDQMVEPKFCQALIIGVAHLDPQGESRLLRAFRQWKPDLITLEVSEYAIAFRRDNGERLRQKLLALTEPIHDAHGQIAALFAKLQIPFEVTAADAYCRECGGWFHCLDDSDLSRQYLNEFAFEAISADNVAHLLTMENLPLARQVERVYRRVRRLLADEPVIPALLGNDRRLAMMQRRDELMQKRVEMMLRERRPRRWIHVGGAEHLLRIKGYRLFYERFADREMHRRLLDNDENEFPTEEVP